MFRLSPLSFFFLELSFSLYQSSLSLSPLSLLSFYLSHSLSLLLSSIILPLSYSHSYYLSYSLSTLSPLSSSHSLISCSLSYLPLFLLRSLLFCLSPILSLLLSLAIYPTLSYSLSLPPDLSLSLLLCLSYSLSSSPHSPLFLSPPSLTLLLSLPLCVSVVGFCGGDTTIRYTVHSLYSSH